jgi:ANTAR domain
VARRAPVILADLADPNERRWPPYVSVMRSHGIRGVFAAPLAVVGKYVGALDLYRAVPGGPMTEQAAGMSIAAGLAQLLLLDLMTSNVHAEAAGPDSDAWPDLIGWSRNEVSQATGMLMTQLNVDAATALARLRAHAYSTGRSATSVAIDIIDRRLRMEAN